MANPCSLCPAHCCKTYTITVTAFDVLRIMGSTGRPYQDFAVLHQARLLSYDPDTTLEMEDDNWVYILGFRSHPCIFLGKDNLCTIHSSAPMSCRRYPYQLDDRLNARFCPLPSQIIFRLKGPDIRKDPLVRELEAYKAIVKEWNAGPEKRSRCIPFLLRKAGEWSF
ncbi:MAG: YkgJ family cysteine cluster protein [Candidatus Micrarchaeia archaeon]